LKKFIVSTLVFIQLISLTAIAGDLKYSIFEIPDSLKKNANSVVRVYETIFRVDNNYKTLNTVLYAVTLLNSKALDEAEMRVYYDNNSSVNYLKFKIYNALGADITRSFKTLEVIDESATSDGTLYSDDRCKVVSPTFAQYPITIEYSYEVKSQVIAYYPSWMPITATNMSLQEASFTLFVPQSQTPRIKGVYQVSDVVKTSDGTNNCYSWKISNIAAIEDEPFSPPYYEQLPFLLLAPDHIKYNDYNNSFRSWDDFGKFRSYLIHGRDLLPPETLKNVEELVKDCPDKRSKIKKVYKYMQDRTRYVGVQIEIGGWQPIPADYVDKKGYGDCKGLVNYTKALLKSIGIESYYTVVKAGNNSAPLIADFPSEQFNHIILCVPENSDTVWLECTSQRNAFGYLGSFTDNRDALIVSDNGGTLVKTPVYSAEENISTRKVSMVIDDAGDASLKITSVNKALQSEEIQDVIFDSPDDQRKTFLRHVGYSDCMINSLQYQLTGDFIPVGTVEADLFVPAYASKSGNRIFIPIVMPDRKISIPQNSTPRVNPVVVRSAFTDCDSIVIRIPDGFSTEFLPGKQNLESRFGKYSLFVELIDNQLHCYRSVVMFANRYNATEYPEFITFLKKIAKADLTKVVLTQKK
jgi:transglutaminase-like putative cysteine protease